MLIKVSQVTAELTKHARQHEDSRVWRKETKVRRGGLEGASGSGTGSQSLSSQKAESFPGETLSLPISNQAFMEGAVKRQLKSRYRTEAWYEQKQHGERC